MVWRKSLNFIRRNVMSEWEIVELRWAESMKEYCPDGFNEPSMIELTLC